MSDAPGVESRRPVRVVVQGGGVGDGEYLLQPDGSLVIPAPFARDVLRAVVRDLTERVRSDGGEVSPAVRGILRALHAAASQPVPERGAFVSETPADQGVSVQEVTAEQAAGLLGCSPQYARRLAKSGRVAARRAGPVWLIDRASLDAFRTGGGL